MIEWMPAAVALSLFALASVVTATYYGGGISYPTPLSMQLLWEHRGRVSWATLGEAWSNGPYDVAFLTTAIVWPFLVRRASSPTSWLAGLLPILLLCPINLVGAGMLVLEMMDPGWDGETLAEGWPLVELYGLWSLWAVGFLVHLWRTRNA